MAGRFLALSARGVADKRAVFANCAVRRTRYLRACPAVTRFAILFTGRSLSKDHGCCPDAAGFNTPKSWASVFHGLQRIGADSEQKRLGHAAEEMLQLPGDLAHLSGVS